MKKVSILIPVYNAESYLAEALESALNQTWNNLEIIVVDDGSTDNSLAIAQKYASDIVKVYQQVNQGPCIARNKAFEMSSGDYIMYLDADDYIATDKIEKQMNQLESYLYRDDVVSFSSWDTFCSSISECTFPKRIIYKNYDQSIDLQLDLLNFGEILLISVWLTPRKLIEKVGLWDSKALLNDDGEFFCRVLMAANKAVFCKDAKVYWRVGHPSLSHSKPNIAKMEGRMYSYMQYEKHLLGKERSYRVLDAMTKVYSGIYSSSVNSYLRRRAFEELTRLGAKPIKPPVTSRIGILVRLLGWRLAFKLQGIKNKYN